MTKLSRPMMTWASRGADNSIAGFAGNIARTPGAEFHRRAIGPRVMERRRTRHAMFHHDAFATGARVSPRNDLVSSLEIARCGIFLRRGRKAEAAEGYAAVAQVERGDAVFYCDFAP